MGANVALNRNGVTDFTGCPYACPDGGYEDLPSGTCVTARAGVHSVSVTSDVRLSLVKDKGSAISLTQNVTVLVEGTDTAETDCAVFMSPQVEWLELPPNATFSPSNEAAETLVPLQLYASGLQERAAPYETTIQVLLQSRGTSNQQAASKQPRTVTFEMPVYLSITAVTDVNTSTWGKLEAGQARTAGCANISAPATLVLRIGQHMEQHFTACQLVEIAALFREHRPMRLPVVPRVPAAPTDPKAPLEQLESVRRPKGNSPQLTPTFSRRRAILSRCPSTTRCRVLPMGAVSSQSSRGYRPRMACRRHPPPRLK